MPYTDPNVYEYYNLLWSKNSILIKRAPNLNANSTHPHPWGPPTPYEALHSTCYNAERIYRGAPTSVKPIENIYKENGFWRNMYLFTKVGTSIGILVSVTDYAMVPWNHTWQTVLARGSYLTFPYTMAGASYVVAQDCFEAWLGDRPISYALAAFAPALILGVHRGDHFRTFNLFVPGFIAGFMFRYNIDMGGEFTKTTEYTIMRRYYEPDKYNPKLVNIFMPDGWRGVIKNPFQRDFDKGPSWKKWLDPEKTPEGPVDY